MAAGVFHVEFGLNETALTQCLEKGNYASAERLILDNVNPSYLDEGCYQRTPLFICLCGMDEGEERTISRNLYLAKLLIERGANVNYRVPVTYFGCEYMGPGKTALDLIIDYYMDLSSQRLHWTSASMWDDEQDDDDQGSPAVDVVVGLHKKYLTTIEDILENLQDLIFIILSKYEPVHQINKTCLPYSFNNDDSVGNSEIFWSWTFQHVMVPGQVCESSYCKDGHRVR